MLIQQFHPGMRLGQQPTLTHSGNLLSSRQGHWDGGSTFHCVAMALAMLGKLADPVHLPYHTFGPEQMLWDDVWPHYLSGMTLDELADFVTELNLGVQTAKSTASGIDLLRFFWTELLAGWPVIIGWQQRHVVKWRAGLVVGIEGHHDNGVFDPLTLLLIDPAGNAPSLAGVNARLALHGNDQFRYQSTTVTRGVKVLGGVSIRSTIGSTSNT